MTTVIYETIPSQSVNKNLVNDLLHGGLVAVKFKKMDGTIREMKATLSQQFIPQSPVVESVDTKTTKKENADVRTVYDVDAGSWKSFRWDRLISVESGV